MIIMFLGAEDSMVECELGEDCRGNRWYHLECLKISSVEELPGK
jgi:hypothetical protein